MIAFLILLCVFYITLFVMLYLLAFRDAPTPVKLWWCITIPSAVTFLFHCLH